MEAQGQVTIARIQHYADQFPAPFPGGVHTLQHGSLTAKLWKGEGYIDMFWHAHAQDELYVIVSGGATFASEQGELQSCGPGDVIFCPAGLRHHFKNFTGNFVVWIFVYGPRGGENERHRVEEDDHHHKIEPNADDHSQLGHTSTV